jgi:DNA-binding phage protein
MPLKTKPFDPTDYLETEADRAAYLADAQQDGPEAVADAEVVVARARTRWAEQPEPRRAGAR